MFITAHLAVGLLVGKLTGNYTLALLGSLFPDLDHLPTYFTNKVFQRKQFWKTVLAPDDPYGNQRNVFHNVFVFSGVALVTLFFPFMMPLILGWGSHLLFDALDKSPYRAFSPLPFQVRGPIPYLSKSEFIFTACVLVFAFLI